MIKKICKEQILTFLILFSISFSLFEKLYNKSSISGKYSVYISLFLFVAAIIINCIKNKGNFVFDCKLFALIPIFLYGFNNESLRYVLFFLLIILWSDFEFIDLHKYHIFLILIGLIWALIDYNAGTIRISGFMLSPTLYSCSVIVSITYLLFEKDFRKSNYLFIMIGLVLIYYTSGSSAFLCGLGLLFYKITINFFLTNKEKKDQIHKNKKIFIKILIFTSILFITYLLVFHLDDLLSIIQRSNREASTSTRLYYLKLFFSQFIENIKMFLIGNGGGYTQFYIRNIVGLATYFPLHQDILMFLCEYGIIGITYIYCFFIRKLRLNLIIILIIILCSFHNLVLSSGLMVLIVITSNTLNKQHNCANIWH